MTILNAVLPVISVLLGAGITYALNVRSHRRSKVEDIYHEAIAAVAVAHAAHDFMADFQPWPGSAPDEASDLNAQLAREGNLNYARAVAEARGALARASAYDQRLSAYIDTRTSMNTVYLQAEEIMTRLRRNIEDGR